jgi:hypothetical protein
MHDLFGPRFYEWWCGLGRGWRFAIALLVLISALMTWFLWRDAWLFWVPAGIAGSLLSLVAAASD